jgi:putative ABC transport system permease protein
VLRISLQTLRARRGSLAGAFVAIFLAVMLAAGTGLLMAGALSAPGPGRLAAADAVVRADPTVTVGHGEDAERVDVVPAPRLPADAVQRAARAPGVAAAIGDVSFAVGARALRTAGVERLQGHGWQSAALTPYRLTAGRAPSGPRDVVVDARLPARVGASIHMTAPGGAGSYRVTGVARGSANRDRGQAAVFFAPAVADALSGAAGRVNAIGIVAEPGVSPAALRERLARPGVEVLDRAHAADADAGDPRAADRGTLIAIFGTMGGIAGFVALFVVAGTFALAIAQRRRETAVLRALGATPRQVRRLIAGEALLVSLVATGLGLLAARPLANGLVELLAGHGDVPAGFAPGHSWIPLAAAAGMGIGIAQLAVVAAARRAGKVRPAEALREVAIEHGRPGVVRTLSGVLALGGGAAMALLFKGEQASAFSILAGILLAAGTALLGRWLLGLPAALLAAPLRALGAPGLLASTGLAANRWRTAALATPILLIAMLAGTQGVVATSTRHDTESVTQQRVTADHVVAGRDGAPLPAGTAERLAGGKGAGAAAGMVPTQVFLLGEGLTGWDAPWSAAGVGGTDVSRALDLGVSRGDVRDVRGTAVAVSETVAAEGHVQVGDVLRARLEDTTAASLRVAAIYERHAGLGHVVMDRTLARRHAAVPADTAVFVAGDRPAAAPGTVVLSRAEYLEGVRTLGRSGAWGIWVIVGLSIAFAALSLINTAAMATAERRGELATLRLLGATGWQAIRMVVLELAPIVAVGLLAGVAVAWVSVTGVPAGVRGIELSVPATLVAGLATGAALLGLAAGAVTARKAVRVTPAAAMRVKE